MRHAGFSVFKKIHSLCVVRLPEHIVTPRFGVNLLCLNRRELRGGESIPNADGA